MMEPYCPKCKEFVSLLESVAGECAVCLSPTELRDKPKQSRRVRRKAKSARTETLKRFRSSSARQAREAGARKKATCILLPVEQLLEWIESQFTLSLKLV